MALIGPDGEQHSHLTKRDVADPASPLGIGKDWRNLPKVNLSEIAARPPPMRPDKGQWVGPPRGAGPRGVGEEVNMTPHEEAVLKATRPVQDEAQVATGTLADDRRNAATSLANLLECANLLPDQRRILVQALGVVGTLP